MCGPDPACDLKNLSVQRPDGCKHSNYITKPLLGCLSTCLLIEPASYEEHVEWRSMEFGVS